MAGVRGRPDGGGTEPTGYWCSPACQAAAIAAERNRPQCLGWRCTRPAAPAKPTGRPAEYCDDKCRKRTESTLNTAMRAVVRDKLPNKLPDLDDLIEKLEFLRASWSPGPVTKIRLGRRFPTPSVPPSPEATRALVNLIGRAAKWRYEIAADAAAEAREKEYAEQAQARHARRVALGQQNDAWRVDLEAALGGEPIIVSGAQLARMRNQEGWSA